MKLLPVSKSAYRLFHNGTLALAKVEADGMRVDMDVLDRTITKTSERIKAMEAELREQDVFTIWKQEFGSKTKLDSGDQLGHVIFKCLDYDPIYFTPTGKPKTDITAFEHVDLPFVQYYIRAKKLKKLLSTYLIGFRREIVDGFVHPFFNLHTVITYRSSCDSPNLQNIPARDEEIARLIRRCFIPRQGHHLLDFDFKAAEVRVAASYTKDPVLVKYCRDKKSDMHKDMAERLFILLPEEVSKAARHSAKNNFVFAEFYGDYFLHCAKNLWESFEKNKITTVNGVPMKEHLRRKGIKELGSLDPKDYQKGMPSKHGTFITHVREVERWYWEEQYSVYTAWKDQWWKAYVLNGGFNTLTGFRVEGVFRRNQVLNSPIQGSAFHCALWLIIEMNKWLVKNKMRSVIVSQVHDSVLVDVHKNELDDVVCRSKTLLERLQKEWPWIIVPLTVEAALTPLNSNWHTKQELAI